jgi:hypothetical protein
MMAYTLLCLGPALLIREWEQHPALRPRRADGLVAGLVLIQLALGVYNPWRYIPTPAMHRSGDTLIETIAATDGEVLVMMHPYYAWRAGKAPSVQIAAMWHARERGVLPLPSDFVARLESGYYTAIISDNSIFETEPALQHLLDTYYQPARVLTERESPPTISGWPVRPSVIYRVRKE